MCVQGYPECNGAVSVPFWDSIRVEIWWRFFFRGNLPCEGVLNAVALASGRLGWPQPHVSAPTKRNLLVYWNCHNIDAVFNIVICHLAIHCYLVNISLTTSWVTLSWLAPILYFNRRGTYICLLYEHEAYFGILLLNLTDELYKTGCIQL